MTNEEKVYCRQMESYLKSLEVSVEIQKLNVGKTEDEINRLKEVLIKEQEYLSLSEQQLNADKLGFENYLQSVET
jgi:hypothetical protein